MNDQFKKLYEKLPKEGIQRTKAQDTKKGYDTDGYGYQWCVDRLNEVLGSDWTFTWEILNKREGAYKSGAPFFEITVSVSISVLDAKPRTCVGGHVSATYSDALKGAITNGFKKTAAFWGVGADAYRGQVDDDNSPLPDSHDNIKQDIGEYSAGGGKYKGLKLKDWKTKDLILYVEWAKSPGAKASPALKEFVAKATEYLKTVEPEKFNDAENLPEWGSDGLDKNKNN